MKFPELFLTKFYSSADLVLQPHSQSAGHLQQYRQTPGSQEHSVSLFNGIPHSHFFSSGINFK
jgi:hypothetical protein